MLSTGGSKSIGLTTAHLLVKRGAHVVLFDRSRADLEQVQAEVSAEKVKIVVGDVSKERDVASLIEQDRYSTSPSY